MKTTSVLISILLALSSVAGFSSCSRKTVDAVSSSTDSVAVTRFLAVDRDSLVRSDSRLVLVERPVLLFDRRDSVVCFEADNLVLCGRSSVTSSASSSRAASDSAVFHGADDRVRSVSVPVATPFRFVLVALVLVLVASALIYVMFKKSRLTRP